MAAQAQDTYLNERLANAGGELYGTSRYVGMGGAMGALGADLSCMTSNPAGIGLYRRSDFGFTAGAQWNSEKVADVKNARGTFDQLGGVLALRTEADKMPFFNLGFNFQKKLNFGGAFIADNANLKGLSQMDQMAELASDGYGTDYNLAGAATYYDFLTPVYQTDAEGNVVVDEKGKPVIGRYYNKFGGQKGFFTHSQWGGLNAFDVNISGNINDRVYFGFGVGFESLKYRAESDYFEQNDYVNEDTRELVKGDYSLYNNYQIDGWGMNMKFGVIVRPFEERPFRFGVALETPSWYQLTSSTLNQLTDEVTGEKFQANKNSLDESYLEYAMHSPVKGRLSLASTVGNYLAWDVDYEFANYGKMGMGYPRDVDYFGASLYNNEPDKAMNGQTKQSLKFQHTLRAGVEYKPTSSVALRIGYNFTSSPYKDNVKFDQYSLDSYAMDYLTHTNYMKVGAANTLTLGLGWKHKAFYVDLAYKARAQKADFYPFDCSFTDAGTQFSQDNPNLAGMKLDPVTANLSRQSMTCTLGFKF